MALAAQRPAYPQTGETGRGAVSLAANQSMGALDGSAGLGIPNFPIEPLPTPGPDTACWQGDLGLYLNPGFLICKMGIITVALC